MADKAIGGDLSVFSINSASQLTFVGEASIAITHIDVDGSVITGEYESAQIVGSEASIKCSLMSILTGTTKVNNLDVSAFTVGGTDYLGSLESGSLKIEIPHEEAKAVGTRWAYPIASGKKTIQMDSDLMVPSSSGAGLALLMDGATTDLEVDASITINSISVTFGALLTFLEHIIAKGKAQRQKIVLKGRVTPPTAPSGTSTILEKFLNTRAAIGFVLTTKASGGATYSGNMLPKSLTMTWANNALVMVETEFASQGSVDISATA